MRRSKDTGDSAEPRRRLLKTVAAGGGALGLGALPGKWAKPMVASVILPAHAQTSGCIGTLANCPDGYLHTYNDSGPLTQGTVTLTGNFPPGITYTNGSLDGGKYTNTSSNVNCPSPCNLPGKKYIGFTASFGNQRKYYGINGTFRCGGADIADFHYFVTGTRSGSAADVATYTGSYSVGITACEYLDLGTTNMRQPLPGQRFRFGG